MFSVGDRIREGRRRLNVTQSGLAKMVGVSSGTIGQWENNQTRPGGKNLLSLSDVLSTDPECLLGIKSDERAHTPNKHQRSSRQETILALLDGLDDEDLDLIERVIRRLLRPSRA